MKQHILPAIKLTVMCLVVFCGLYSLLIFGIAQAAPNKGQGQTVTVNNHVAGYRLEGQLFTADKYFNGRPSAAGYNAAGSSGSNKGPSNPDYLKAVQNRIDSFLVHNPTIEKGNVPSDLVTASGSGLDPDISLQAAMVQADRIAKARSIPKEKITSLIQNHIERSSLNGIEKINVLMINIELDTIK
ncbi:MAG: K(+)-transporting ATPase subunit [Sediminibacterium sp.]|nr:K(+)-transporting ATPase subunit [Sediminibacterium sp.]